MLILKYLKTVYQTEYLQLSQEEATCFLKTAWETQAVNLFPSLAMKSLRV